MYKPKFDDEGSTSEDFDTVSAFISACGFTDPAAYESIKNDLTGDHVILTSIADIEAQKSYFPLATIIDGNEVITEHGEKFYNTLSTIAKLFKDPEYWKTKFCGVTTKSITLNNYRSNIKNVEGLFMGNCNIKPYSG